MSIVQLPKCKSCNLPMQMDDPYRDGYLCGNRQCKRFKMNNNDMNNLEKAKLALRSGSKRKLKWIIISVAGETLPELDKLSDPMAIKESVIKGFGLKPYPIDAVRVDFHYEDPMHNRTTGGPQRVDQNGNPLMPNQPITPGQTVTSPLSPTSLNRGATFN